MAHQAVLAIAPNVTMWRKTCYVSFSGSAITRRTQFLCQSPKGLTLRAQAKKDDDNKKDGEENWSENLGKVADSLKGVEKFNKVINLFSYLKLVLDVLRLLYKMKLIEPPTALLPLFEDDQKKGVVNEKKEDGEKGEEGFGKTQSISCENLHWTTTINCVHLHSAQTKEAVADENPDGTADKESK